MSPVSDQAVRAPADPVHRPRATYALAVVIAVVSCLFFLAVVFVVGVARAGGLFYGTFTDFLLTVATVVVVAGLVAAAVVAVAAARSNRFAAASAQPPAGAGGSVHAAGALRQRAVMLAIAAALVAGSILFFLAFNELGLGYGVLGRLVVIGAGAMTLVGMAAAVVVTIFAFLPHRSTSLRTRTFGVIVVVVLIPSMFLAALGVWAYYRSWETATTTAVDQAQYRAAELANEVGTVQRQRARYSAAQRAMLANAIAQMYGRQGHQEGAQLATLAQIRQTQTLPGWAIASLEKVGYAIGNERGPGALQEADTVAWRVGPQTVRYYVPVWTGGSTSPPVPVDRLFWIAIAGLALIFVLGLGGTWILSSSVVRPVRRLAEASCRLAEGEAGVTVTPQGPRELRELAVSFNDMNAKLAKAQETEQAFLLSVSHELKTPLTSVRGYAEGIADGTVTPPEGATVIGAEASRLERLVGDLLESGRMRKSAFTVRREDVDLAAVAEDVARRYEVTARDAGLTLLLQTEAGALVTADHDRVLQVVSNLVENAIRCTPAPGSVTITTTPATIAVSDTGRGLTSDDLPRAFERFYLYSRYGTDRPVGTGLGLAIVKELTEAMGGTVTVSSALGVGTAFSVALPSAGAAPPAGPDVPPSAPAASPTGPPAPPTDPVVAPTGAAAAPAEPATPAPDAGKDDVA